MQINKLPTRRMELHLNSYVFIYSSGPILVSRIGEEGWTYCLDKEPNESAVKPIKK